MKSVKPILLFILIASFGAADAIAQSGGYAGSFSRMGFSARGMAMGNAMTAVHHEGSYAYYNPAMAAIPTETIQLDFSTAALRFDRQLHMVTANIQLPPSAGLSISLLNARVGNIDGRTSSGYHTGMLSVNEFQLIGNFAIRFSERIWAGVGIKYNLANYHTELPNSQNIGIDAGFRFALTNRLTFAVAIKDLLSEYRFDSSDLFGQNAGSVNVYSFPLRLITGTAYEVSDAWLLSFDAEFRFQSSDVLRADTTIRTMDGFPPMVRTEEISQTTFFRAGSRYSLHERVTIRAGFEFYDAGGENQLQPTAGFSLHLPYDRFSPSIDYAFVREPSQFSSMHVFSIRLHI
ncbi:MAG: hypothetical protein EA391_07540 [Balneolaceae bacterium]|nr:MAG: hypothetical protein EA391_07540 [Balneolaceae bacterium]